MSHSRFRQVLVVSAVCAAVLAGCKDEEKKSGKAAVPAPVLPADDYRQEITTIDRLVFSSVLDDRTRMMVVGNLAALAGRLDTPGRPEPVRETLQELRELAVRISDRRVATAEQLQGEWSRVRAALFGSRDWFATSVGDTNQWMAPGALRTDTMQPGQAGGGNAAAPPRFELPGRWSVVDVEVNGMPANDSDAVGATWEFEDGGLEIDRGPVAGRYSFVEYIDSRGEALRLEAEDESLSGWMLYRFTPEGRLLVSFHEGLSERPEGFDAPDEVEVVPSTETTGTATATSTAGAADARAAERERARQERLRRSGRPMPRAGSGPAHYRVVLDPVQ